MANSMVRLALAVSFIVALTACSRNQTNGSKEADGFSANDGVSTPSAFKEPNPKPIELVFYGAGFSEEPFMLDYGNAIKEKFPHITVKFIRVDTAKLSEVIASGAQLDIQLSVDFQLKQNMIDFGLQYDHAELIHKYKYDTGKLNIQMMETLRSIGGGKLYGLPIYLTIPSLLYNKDLFDKFGVGYPKDGMTWDEAYELAKKMTRNEGGISYRGMVVAFQALSVHNQLSLNFVDTESGKALFSSNGNWQKHVNNLTRFYKIPGNEVDDKTIQGAAQNNFFFKDKAAAMFATVAGASVFSLNPSVNMDVATIPFYPDLQGVSGRPSAGVFGVSALSKQKDEAFQVIAFLASKEFQLKRSKLGAISVLSNDEEIRKAFGAEDAAWKGKNIQAMNPSRFAAPGRASNYDHLALPNILGQMNLVAQGSVDVNTALRTAGELTEKAIEDMKSRLNNK
ncbi:MAG: extracellular solute-binding protein family 1 [Paenibacillus sp.]|jgi:multiple sugar transport system substrate-binding protein|nr:extracellular solute-binding protein family 1 [Paenibacillus sp.]